MCVGQMPKSEPLVGQFRTNTVSKMEVINENGKVLKEDLLSLTSVYTQLVFKQLKQIHESFENSIFYKILFHTTQPAHMITAIAVIMVSLMLIPTKNQSSMSSPLWSLIYLAAFSTHFGAQIWMTFVSGLSLYFALPRHNFGNVQRVLFPKYFLLNAALSLITLYIFARAHRNELDSTIIAQVVGLTICFLIELVIRLYLTPPLLSLITIKTRIEMQAGVGMEVGKYTPGELLNCPHYVTIHKAFRKVHMTIAIGNVITMACTMFHLYYISQKLCIL